MVADVAERKLTGFGKRLRELRTAAELTQEALGAKAGMRYQAIAKLERGTGEPTWPTVLKLAAALGVEPNDFLPREE